MLLQNGDGEGKSYAEGESQRDVPAAITDTGCERKLNEDRYAVVESSSGVAWLVCDGMGGSTGGELAAQLAIDAIRRELEAASPTAPALALKGAIQEANRKIVLRRQNPAFASMGTTVVGAIFKNKEVCIAQVGDSRAYLVRDGAIQQLTVDHTYVQELVDRGQIKPEDALSHPQAHILTRCIGSEPGLEIDLRKFWVWQAPLNEPDDYLLLCTDGLYSMVTDAEIAGALASASPQKACVELVELAKQRGGFDNITVAIIPIKGQLKTEPPLGYTEEEDNFTTHLPGIPLELDKDKEREDWIKFVVILTVLAGLSALAAAVLGLLIMVD